MERRKTVRYHGECIIHLLNLGEGCEVFLEGFPSEDEGRLKIVSPWPLAHFTEKKKKKNSVFVPFHTRNLESHELSIFFFFFKLFFSINFIFHKLKKKKRIFFFYRLDRFQLSEMISNSVSRKVTSLHRAIKVFLNEFFLVHFIERVLCLFNYNVKDILNIHVYVYIFTKRKGNYSINIHLCRARINVK